MMNKEQSSRFRLVSYLLLTPLVLGSAALLTFSCQKESLETMSGAKESEDWVLRSSNHTFEIDTLTPIKEHPLYILNGETIDEKQLLQLAASSIESITVLKNESANSLYGEKAKNGVILIVTKAPVR